MKKYLVTYKSSLTNMIVAQTFTEEEHDLAVYWKERAIRDGYQDVHMLEAWHDIYVEV